MIIFGIACGLPLYVGIALFTPPVGPGTQWVAFTLIIIFGALSTLVFPATSSMVPKPARSPILQPLCHQRATTTYHHCRCSTCCSRCCCVPLACCRNRATLERTSRAWFRAHFSAPSRWRKQSVGSHFRRYMRRFRNRGGHCVRGGGNRAGHCGSSCLHAAYWQVSEVDMWQSVVSRCHAGSL